MVKGFVGRLIMGLCAAFAFAFAFAAIVAFTGLVVGLP